MRAGDGCGQRQGSPRERLREGDDIWRHPRRRAGEHGACAPETREDFIEDQQEAEVIRQRAQIAQDLIVMKHHPARALYARLHQNGGEFMGVGLDQLAQSRQRIPIARQIADHLGREDPCEFGVHALFGVADGHGGEGVAVVAAAKAQDFRAPGHAPVHPVLHRHLHGDLDRNRARFGEEHPLEIARQQGREARGELVGLLMGEPAEHHMGQAGQLLAQGLRDMGMIVAMAGGPPAGDSIHQHAPVSEGQPHALARHHGEGPRGGLHLRIGQPDVIEASREPARLSAVRRRHRWSCRGARRARHRDPRPGWAWSTAGRPRRSNWRPR